MENEPTRDGRLADIAVEQSTMASESSDDEPDTMEETAETDELMDKLRNKMRRRQAPELDMSEPERCLLSPPPP